MLSHTLFLTLTLTLTSDANLALVHASNDICRKHGRWSYLEQLVHLVCFGHHAVDVARVDVLVCDRADVVLTPDLLVVER